VLFVLCAAFVFDLIILFHFLKNKEDSPRQQLSASPLVAVFEDVINSEECSHMMRIGRGANMNTMPAGGACSDPTTIR